MESYVAKSQTTIKRQCHTLHTMTLTSIQKTLGGILFLYLYIAGM